MFESCRLLPIMTNNSTKQLTLTLPSQVLSNALLNASTRKRRSLEILDSVCREQQQRGSVDFSIATIGQLSAKAGGPATQSIRNKEGKDYRELISAWSSSNSSPKLGKPKGSISQALEGVLTLIPDASAKALVGLIISENKKLKGENAILKNAANVTIDIRPQSNNSSPQLGHTLPELMPVELDALREAISTNNLKKLGWTLDPATGKVSKDGRTIFKPGFGTALKKLTSV